VKTASESSVLGAANGSATADGRTRDRVARLLLQEGPSTAASLGDRLGLSPAAIRRHLDAMLLDGTISTRTPRPQAHRGRGRPAKLYALTDAGHAAGPTAYEDLAAGALRALREFGGDDALASFAAARAADLERRLGEASAGVDPSDRPEAVAAAMSAAGYAAGVTHLPSGAQLCQHHCPVQHVAELFPLLCEAETAALARVLDSHVQRLATIAHGDGVCTTHIPASPAPKADSTTANPTPSTSSEVLRA
jgi:predicted ArsR family transcriptional regulator